MSRRRRQTAPAQATPAGEGQSGLRGPVVPAVAHQRLFLAVLHRRANESEEDDGAVEHQGLGASPITSRWTTAQSREAPHHRVAGDGEDAVRRVLPRSAARRAAPDCRRTSRRTGSRPATSATVPTIQTASPTVPQLRLAADGPVEPDHRAEGDQRRPRNTGRGTALSPIAPTKRRAERVRHQRNAGRRTAAPTQDQAHLRGHLR